MGVSVVPTTAWPCQGIANMTRPSRVCGTMIAVLPGRKRPVQNNMHTLAWREQPFRLGIVLEPKLIAERPGRIDNTAGLQVMFPSRLLIPEFQAGDHSGFILGQAQDAGLIQEAGAALCCGLREVDEQAAIVKLTIVVKHTAAQAVAL